MGGILEFRKKILEFRGRGEVSWTGILKVCVCWGGGGMQFGIPKAWGGGLTLNSVNFQREDDESFA